MIGSMVAEGPARVLRERMVALDAAHRPWSTAPGAAGLLQHATSVLSARTGAEEAVTGPGAALEPTAADVIVAGCRLLAELRGEQPALVTGPLDRDAQQWVGLARHDQPDQAHFRAPPPDLVPDPKPFGFGLFTSTAANDGRGSWRTYLEPYRGSSLYPLPWTVWDLPVGPGARVREVTSAQEWAALIEEYPAHRDGLAQPAWQAVVSDWDGIHVTLAAVAAFQGLVLRTAAGPSAPAYWDLESTFWLRWRFGPPRHREDVS
jgi:hypothetical protein